MDCPNLQGYCMWHIAGADVLDNMLAGGRTKNKAYSFVSSVSDYTIEKAFRSGNLLKMLYKLLINSMLPCSGFV